MAAALKDNRVLQIGKVAKIELKRRYQTRTFTDVVQITKEIDLVIETRYTLIPS